MKEVNGTEVKIDADINIQAAKEDAQAGTANEDVKAAPEAPKGPQPQHVIQITLFDNGGIQLNGPLENILLMYGMLEAAKDALRGHHADAARNQPKIVKPSLMDRVLIRGRNLKS